MLKNFLPVSKKGLTLIELLVVVVIISILAGITIQIINPVAQRNRAKDARQLSFLKKAIVAVEAYERIHGEYPEHDYTCSTSAPENCEVLTYLSSFQVSDVQNDGNNVLFTIIDESTTSPSFNLGADARPSIFRYHTPSFIGGTCIAVHAFSERAVYMWKPPTGIERCTYTDAFDRAGFYACTGINSSWNTNSDCSALTN